MPSSRSPVPVVVLALNAPFYAPILLAKTLAINPTCGQMELEIAGFPPSFDAESTAVDPFISRVFSQHQERILIGIGDPMRITAIPRYENHYVIPKVIGSLIHKMCYWLVDHRFYDIQNNQWEEVFERILVHPRGMTGFTVPCYDYHLRNGVEATDLKNKLESLIFDKINPNNERHHYDNICKAVQEKRVDGLKDFAFITTNPLHAIETTRFGSDYTLIRAFAKENEFCDVVQTGILTDAALISNPYSMEAQVIEEFKHGVITAINHINDNPHRAAYYLFRANEKHELLLRQADGSIVKPYFDSWKPEKAVPRYLAASLEILSTQNLSVYTPSLEITPEQWSKTQKMRTIVEGMLPTFELRNKAVDLAYEQYCI